VRDEVVRTRHGSTAQCGKKGHKVAAIELLLLQELPNIGAIDGRNANLEKWPEFSRSVDPTPVGERADGRQFRPMFEHLRILKDIFAFLAEQGTYEEGFFGGEVEHHVNPGLG
jgi:hypothetical protein